MAQLVLALDGGPRLEAQEHKALWADVAKFGELFVLKDHLLREGMFRWRAGDDSKDSALKNL